MSKVVLPEKREPTNTDLRPFLDQVNKYVEIDGHAGIVDFVEEDEQEIRVAMISGGIGFLGRIIFIHRK